MSITLNGKSVDLLEGVNTVEQLLSHYQLENRIVIVEVNKEIVMKENYKTMSLSHGDVVEIIHFVGGG
ncbi:sulfur carrier protein [Neobacillus niacini]|jgi:sulfur carrier protein|uniref:sulfur carrier protein ThiS n=1 Tax=Neobacillus niacini TaxID=86668 RepID=UPI00277ECE67|nr:sulfur carrier protein ThiS [Neobacillus niacini]MDQ1002986.1 sulfur carrier protein [Neobacillus niacini]